MARAGALDSPVSRFLPWMLPCSCLAHASLSVSQAVPAASVGEFSGTRSVARSVPCCSPLWRAWRPSSATARAAMVAVRFPDVARAARRDGDHRRPSDHPSAAQEFARTRARSCTRPALTRPTSAPIPLTFRFQPEENPFPIHPATCRTTSRPSQCHPKEDCSAPSVALSPDRAAVTAPAINADSRSTARRKGLQWNIDPKSNRSTTDGCATACSGSVITRLCSRHSHWLSRRLILLMSRSPASEPPRVSRRLRFLRRSSIGNTSKSKSSGNPRPSNGSNVLGRGTSRGIWEVCLRNRQLKQTLM